MRARSAVDMPKYCATEPSESPARTVYGKNLRVFDGLVSAVDDPVAGDEVAGDPYDEGEAGRTLPGGSSEPYPGRDAAPVDGAFASCARTGTALSSVSTRTSAARRNEDFRACIEKAVRIWKYTRVDRFY